MELNDFSSVFELVTAYNFVNALNKNSEVWKILDLTTPVQEKVNTASDSLSLEIEDAISKYRRTSESEARLLTIADLKKRVLRIEALNTNHPKQSSNLYLLCGLFSFMMLLLAGFIQDHFKLASLAIVALSMILLIPALLFCERGKTPGWIKSSMIIVLSFLILYVLTSKLFHYSYFKDRNDQFYLLWIFFLSSLLISAIFRQRIANRKLYKALYIIVFFTLLFIPSLCFGYDYFYVDSNKEMHIDIVIIGAIFLCLFAFFYDLLFHSYLSWRIHKIDKEFQPIRELVQAGVSKSNTDLSPFKTPDAEV